MARTNTARLLLFQIRHSELNRIVLDHNLHIIIDVRYYIVILVACSLSPDKTYTYKVDEQS